MWRPGSGWNFLSLLLKEGLLLARFSISWVVSRVAFS
jgi:hypothetical protein